MSDQPAPQSLRTEAIEALLVERKLLTPEDIDTVLTTFSEQVGPMNGATLVSRAWTDEAFKTRLLEDATTIIQEYGFEGGQVDKLVVKACTESVHHVVVCTLCSCYPWAVLGLPPRWYKDPGYRSRIVREPRAVLQEMGLTLPETTAIKVWDSSAEIRYMVLPLRPPGLEALDETALTALITRDAMIGVAAIEQRA